MIKLEERTGKAPKRKAPQLFSKPCDAPVSAGDIHSAWMRPAKGGGYVGFWMFNHLEVKGRPSMEEISWQLTEMHSKGIREVIVHSRFGHAIPYLSQYWREIFEMILGASQRLGMKIWIWDEDSWPPGYAGGKVTHENPEYRGRMFSCATQDVQGGKPLHLKLPEGTPVPVTDVQCPPHPSHCGYPVAVFAVEKKSREIIDVTAQVGPSPERWVVSTSIASYQAPYEVDASTPYPRANKVLSRYYLHWTPPQGEWEIVSFLINEGHYYYSGWVVDALNPAAVRAWIDATYEWYWKHFEKYFINTIKGFYTSEPPTTRWTPGLFSAFQELKGYDLRPLLPHLSVDIDARTPRIRIDYQEVHSELYRRGLIAQARRWCDAHGIDYMARLHYEDAPTKMAEAQGNAMTSLREFSAQCVDIISGLQIGTRKHPSLNLGMNLGYSISRQQGTLPGFECVGPIDWRTSAADSRILYDWGFVSGANKVWNENMFYSVDGYRKGDCPPSQFYQCPEWPYFDRLVERYDRLATLSRFGKDIRSVGLICTMSSIFAHTSGFRRGKAISATEQKLVAMHQDLLEAQVPFDVVDEGALDSATVEKGALRVGKARYETLILTGCTHLPAGRCEILERFSKAGGCLIVESGARIVKVLPWRQGGTSRSWKPTGAIFAKSRDEILRHRRVSDFRIAPFPADALSRRWTGKGFEAVAVLNTSRAMIPLPWPEKDSGWEQWCLETGARFHAMPQGLGGGEMAVFVKCKKPAAPPSPLPLAKVKHRIRLDGEWDFSGLENTLFLDRWTLYAGKNGLSPEVLRAPAFFRTWTHYETGVGPLYRQVMLEEGQAAYNPAQHIVHDNNMPRIAPSSLPRWIYYHTYFTLHAGFSREIRLLMETEGISGEWHLWMNGRKLRGDAFRFERVYDVGNRVASLRRHLRPGGVNEVIIAVRASGPSDGLIHPLRLLGDFRIDGHPRPELFAPRKTTVPGSWTAQGYPHASGRARYRRMIPPEVYASRKRCQVILDCGEVMDSCRVHVNGREVGARLWAPFHFDLTPFLDHRAAELVIEVANNAGNQIAGESKVSGLIGPVQLCFL